MAEELPEEEEEDEAVTGDEAKLSVVLVECMLHIKTANKYSGAIMALQRYAQMQINCKRTPLQSDPKSEVTCFLHVCVIPRDHFNWPFSRKFL